MSPRLIDIFYQSEVSGKFQIMAQDHHNKRIHHLKNKITPVIKRFAPLTHSPGLFNYFLMIGDMMRVTVIQPRHDLLFFVEMLFKALAEMLPFVVAAFQVQGLEPVYQCIDNVHKLKVVGINVFMANMK